MSERSPLAWTRRRLLSSVVLAGALGAGGAALARSISGSLPFAALSADPPIPVDPNGWLFFTPQEARLVEAIVDRLIPADEMSPGGKDCGCAVFIDRQLAGAFGSSSRLYTSGPFLPGLPTQGWQGEANPAQRYRVALAAFEAHARREKGGKSFAELPGTDQDALLTELETGKVTLAGGADSRSFFNLLLGNTMEGFFADPIYGGNRNMASWRMIGFPGARYDYRDHVAKHNETYPRPPVSIAGGPEWTRL